MSQSFPSLPDFETFLKKANLAEKYIEEKTSYLQNNTSTWKFLLQEYQNESSTSGEGAYPSQGLIRSPYDQERSCNAVLIQQLSDTQIDTTLKAWLYYLEVFNHPERVKNLFADTARTFRAPKKAKNMLMDQYIRKNKALSISDLALTVRGSQKPRTKRTERLLHGPFLKLGHQARSLFVGSANPDIFGTAPAIATMAMAHSLCGVPRDGFFSDPKRQADLAKKAFEWIDNSPVLVGRPSATQGKLKKMWKKNVMGVLEATPDKALIRCKVLYEAGVRTFRIYSPEPGTGALKTLQAIRKLEMQQGWEEIELFVGQLIDVEQAQQLELAGATGIYIGIGGGGRCTTGVRSGVAINWPQLVWELRGKTNIPLIVEGGASDNIGQTLALGASGIGVTRTAGGGTIESPGGFLFLADSDQADRFYKPYGGEASARMKWMGGRVGPFELIPYIEGESTRAHKAHGRGNIPTLAQKIFLLFGDAVLAMVFQNVNSIKELQQIGPDSLVKVTPADVRQRFTH